MSQNFSNAKSQENVTFKELNFLIDQWISDIQENLNVFSLQSDEINKLTLDICNARQKLEVLYQRINFVKCLQENVDQTLNYVRNDQAGIQQLVNKVEGETSCVCNRKDVFRRNTYKLAEDLNSTFFNFKEVLEELRTRTGHLNIQNYCGNNVEHIAQLLQAQLGQLETIEVRVHEIRNLLGQTEYYKQHVLASLHLKENKL